MSQDTPKVPWVDDPRLNPLPTPFTQAFRTTLLERHLSAHKSAFVSSLVRLICSILKSLRLGHVRLNMPEAKTVQDWANLAN